MNYDNWKLTTPPEFFEEKEPNKCSMCNEAIEEEKKTCDECILEDMKYFWTVFNEELYNKIKSILKSKNATI